jgi:hypothetical protein
MPAHANSDFLLHPSENLKLFKQAWTELDERFDPQDRFEDEFVRMLLSALWLRGRYECLDFMVWEAAIHRAGVLDAAHLAVSKHLDEVTLERSRYFRAAKDRCSQDFHRVVRSWNQYVAKSKTPKQKEPN